MLKSFSAFAALLVASYAQADIAYHLRVFPKTQTFQVTMDVQATADKTVFHIPAWSPGYYVIQNYENTISEVKAMDGQGHALTVAKADTRGWAVTAAKGSQIQFTYKVLATDGGLGFFGAKLTDKTGFVNGASTFMYVDDRKTEPDTLDVALPNGWDISSALDKSDAGVYEAKTGYDEFIDAPIQMGTFSRKKFTVEGVPYEVIFVAPDGKVKCDEQFEADRLKKVSAPAQRLFGGSSFKHYTYILHLQVGSFAGGLEHRACTCIAVDNTPVLDGMDDLAGHENFHAWNVKQIRPFVLGPFDYSQPVRTGNLWWMEGVTDYYAKLVCYRSGLEDTAWLLSQFRGSIAELQDGRTRTTLTLEDCSRQCWENGGFSVGDLSYYTKGLLVGLILDASIREQTHGAKSLDDVIRLLYAKYKLPNPGVPEDGILAAINEVVGKPSMNALYNEMTRTTGELPYDVLRSIGLRVYLRNGPSVSQGFTFRDGVVTSVSADADRIGLRVGDRLIEIDDHPWDGVDAADRDKGTTVTVERNGDRAKLTIPYVIGKSDRYDIEVDPAAGPEAKARLAEWLKRDNGGVKESN